VGPRAGGIPGQGEGAPSSKRRAQPAASRAALGEGLQVVSLRRAARQGVAGRSLRGTEPGDRPSLHARDGEGGTQRSVYPCSYGPEMKEGCPSCSWWADPFDAALPHLGARDVTLAVVS